MPKHYGTSSRGKASGFKSGARSVKKSSGKTNYGKHIAAEGASMYPKGKAKSAKSGSAKSAKTSARGTAKGWATKAKASEFSKGNSRMRKGKNRHMAGSPQAM